MIWRALAEVVVVAHYAFLAYLVLGGFVAWHWRRTIVTHVLTAGWALLIVFTRVPCPLTSLQNSLRERGGQRPYGEGFIAHYVTGTLYPAAQERLWQIVVAAVVVVSWLGFARAGVSAKRRSG